MKATLLIVTLMVATTLSGIAFAHPSPPSYELYSWPQTNGVWNFCLLPSPSGANISIETIFNKKFRLTGVDQLKQKISLLPTDTTIFWINGFTSGQTATAESKKFALPPTETVEQVKRYAGKRGIHVQVPNPNPD